MGKGILIDAGAYKGMDACVMYVVFICPHATGY
jgi:hypothetical protein